MPFPASGFTAQQWRLITKLPAEVMIATIAIRDGDSPDDDDSGGVRRRRHTVAEGLAGLDAIAAGRSSDSDLVRAVVAAIYAEPEEDRPEQPAHRDPQALRTQVLADCRQANEILRAVADPADGAAYRHWVQQVAVRVCAAARSGGVLGLGVEPSFPGQPAGGEADLDRFLAELGAALS
ncbi:MAG TPA: hypothetical protein VIL37_10715 [Natronosporangium sp.]